MCSSKSAIDIGMLLYNYVPEKNWSDWFKTYGVEENIELNISNHCTFPIY
jgi:thiamine kinase-like enzyme